MKTTPKKSKNTTKLIDSLLDADERRLRVRSTVRAGLSTVRIAKCCN
jgi:hypothetical protein